MKKKIIIIGGDPNSINSEIIYKSWKNLNSNLKKKYLYHFKLFTHEKQFHKLKYPINLIKVKNIRIIHL